VAPIVAQPGVKTLWRGWRQLSDMIPGAQEQTDRELSALALNGAKH